jgi:hypothetical protein
MGVTTEPPVAVVTVLLVIEFVLKTEPCTKVIWSGETYVLPCISALALQAVVPIPEKEQALIIAVPVSVKLPRVFVPRAVNEQLVRFTSPLDATSKSVNDE